MNQWSLMIRIKKHHPSRNAEVIKFDNDIHKYNGKRVDDQYNVLGVSILIIDFSYIWLGVIVSFFFAASLNNSS